MAIKSKYITADIIEVGEFPELGRKYRVSIIPKIVINENVQFEGALPESDFLDKLMQAAG